MQHKVKALTAAQVAKEKPDPGKRREIPDAGSPGLFLQIQKSGRKSWALRYRRPDGRTAKLTLGAFSDRPATGEPVIGGPLTLADARKLAAGARRQRAQGQDPAALRQREKAAAKAVPPPDTFGAAAREFIERHAMEKNRSWKERARLLGLRPHGDDLVEIDGGPVAMLGSRPAGEITKADVRDLLQGIVDRGAPVGSNRALSVIRKLYNYLLEHDAVTASPVAGLKPLKAEKSRNRVLSDAELLAVWHAAERQAYPFGALTQLLILTAQRRGEVAGMAWSELDLAERVWLIPRERTKNGREHAVPLSEQACRIIASVSRVAGLFVFSTTGETPVSGFSKGKKELDAIAKSDGAEVAPWGYHDLRRTAASGMAKLGVLPHVLEAVLNHKSGTIEGVGAIYNKYQYATEKREALEKWAQHIQWLIAN